MKNRRNDLTAEYVRSILEYDSDKGTFKWKSRPNADKSWNTRYAGKAAGGRLYKGYRIAAINKTLYRAHRLAWLCYYGEWPNDQIDHINMCKSDNRIKNLREATDTQNRINEGVRKDNKSGFRGVYLRKDTKIKSFQSFISAHGKRICLGTFKTAELAYAAYCTASKNITVSFQE